MKKISLIFLAISTLYSCKKEEGCTDPLALNYSEGAIIDDGNCEYFAATPYTIETPYGFPDMITPSNNPTTIEGVFLGKKLFHDEILS
ncbi:MAG: hypothetical protein QF383_03370, partial [Flavobacteriales bacterium]|nr:hypothetical protein [Flavobacteriales bacterium]